jgi:uncharacterized protein (TIGR02284 family)
MNAQKSVEQLNSFLRGEISAEETYRQALQKVKDTSTRGQLEQCAQSHHRSAELLKERIIQLGGKPSEGSGAWGAFAKIVEAGSTAFGEKAAVAALEEGEDHGLKDYQRDLSDLDSESRTLIENTLLPAQQRTHSTLSALKKTLN